MQYPWNEVQIMKNKLVICMYIYGALFLYLVWILDVHMDMYKVLVLF